MDYNVDKDRVTLKVEPLPRDDMNKFMNLLKHVGRCGCTVRGWKRLGTSAEELAPSEHKPVRAGTTYFEKSGQGYIEKEYHGSPNTRDEPCNILYVALVDPVQSVPFILGRLNGKAYAIDGNIITVKEVKEKDVPRDLVFIMSASG